MISTLIASERRALRRSVFGLAAVAALAACDTERAVAPHPTAGALPSSASAAVGPSTQRLTWTVAGMNGLLVGGATFTWNDGSGPITIADNSSLDLDKTPGELAIPVTVKAGEVCPVQAPSGWVLPDTNCRWVEATRISKDIGSFYVIPEYSVFFHTNFSQGGPIGPATYTVRSLTTRYMVTVVDNGKLDRWTDMGSLWVHLPAGGDYEVCQSKPAPGTVLYDAPCHTVTVSYGTLTFAGIFVNWPIIS